MDDFLRGTPVTSETLGKLQNIPQNHDPVYPFRGAMTQVLSSTGVAHPSRPRWLCGLGWANQPNVELQKDGTATQSDLSIDT